MEKTSDDRDAIRIAVVGDSFTFGWGVDENDAWPRVLEKILRTHNHQVTVFNLGKTGASPEDYASIVSKMIPVVRPDLLLVAILQGDDLAQLKNHTNQNSVPDTGPKPSSYFELLRLGTSQLLRKVIPNTMQYRRSTLHTQSTLLSTVWKKDALETIGRWNSEQRERFHSYDTTIKRMFLDGDLNPSLVYLAITDPRYFLDTWDLNSHYTATLIESMSEYLARINNVCINNKVKPLVTIVHTGLT